MGARRKKLAAEGGYSFPELLVAVMVGLLVAAGAATVVIGAVRSQPQATERAGQIQQGRTMLERITRELRQGDVIQNASASGLRIHTYTNAADCGGAESAPAMECWITYSCASSACTRTPDGGTAETVVSGISGPNVFCYSAWDGEGACPAVSPANPGYVAVRLVFPRADGGEAVTLDDGAELRNYTG